MIKVSDAEFERLIADGLEAIPPLYQKHLQNVAFVIADEPTTSQRRQLNLYQNELLFGLYEGVPLPQRFGAAKLLPDKITIFKKPAEAVSRNLAQLREHIRHTVWHEVAHYYGLDHRRIHQLERKHMTPLKPQGENF
ncbi:metallopeptidase family protein [Candidatus Saccharibacteria bacterium]|nr:metallopeptidase family protein [Candidatus Saccharibacteria bacterium]